MNNTLEQLLSSDAYMDRNVDAGYGHGSSSGHGSGGGYGHGGGSSGYDGCDACSGRGCGFGSISEHSYGVSRSNDRGYMYAHGYGYGAAKGATRMTT